MANKAIARLGFKTDEGTPRPATVYLQPAGGLIVRDDATNEILSTVPRTLLRYTRTTPIQYVRNTWNYVPLEELE